MKRCALIIFALANALGAIAEEAQISSTACPEGQAVSFEEIAASHKAILYGEYHGTQEMPAMFADAVAAAAGSDRRVVVALEYPADWQADLDAVMSAPNEVAALDAFADHHTADGRTSNAMRNMLLQLRALKAAGADIHVIAADTRRIRTQAERAAVAALDLPVTVDRTLGVRDLDMALKAKAACEETACELILLYAGNFHTRLATFESYMLNTETGEKTPFRVAPVGYVLSQFMPAASVYLVHRGGYAFNQRGNAVGMNEVYANAPDFVHEDGVYYCTGPDSISHVLSVGRVSSSADTLAPAKKDN